MVTEVVWEALGRVMHQIWVTIHKKYQTSLWGGGLEGLSVIQASKPLLGALQHASVEPHARHQPPRRLQAPHTAIQPHARIPHNIHTHMSSHTPWPSPYPPYPARSHPPTQHATHTFPTRHATTTCTLATRNPAPPNQKPTIAHASQIPHITRSAPAAV